jgi:hypothetical protein
MQLLFSDWASTGEKMLNRQAIAQSLGKEANVTNTREDSRNDDYSTLVPDAMGLLIARSTTMTHGPHHHVLTRDVAGSQDKGCSCIGQA